MFYLAYLRNELVRRKGRTIQTMLGLAVGIALVVAIAALSRGLDRAQATALDPLATIGTDLTVTRTAEAGDGPFGGASPQLLSANRSVLTDLSKLGKPGEKFVHDFFLPGTQLTFPQGEARQIASLPGVAAVATGLTLQAIHQAGTVPKIVAELQTGGQEFQIDRRITPLTPAEIAKVQACAQKAGGPAPEQSAPQGAPEPPQGERGGAVILGQGGFGPLRECLPARFQRFRATFRTPRETLRQVLDPPQTNIESEPYAIAGVDLSQPEIGLVTPAQVAGGRFLSGGKQALVATSYAARHGLKVGSKLNLNGTRFAVVGLVRPPLGGQSADVYLPLGQLQRLANQKGMANVVLVRAADSASVADVQKAIEDTVEGAEVASAEQVADQVSGSLVDAAELSDTVGLALAIAAAAAAFLLAALLASASVGKRVRELGTLKAIGWTQGLVVRQVVGESLVVGILGGLLGIVLGVVIAVAIGEFGPTLAASTTVGGESLFGLGEIAERTVTRDVALTAPVPVSLVAIGFGLALLGGLLAGAAAALRAARLRPADALRQVE